MTELQPAHFTQGGCHTAQGDRRLTSSLVCAEGVHQPAGGDLAVTTAGAGLGINIAAGSAFIDGDNIATQGMYHVYNDGTVLRTLAAANPTDPRIDGVFATVRDSQYAGVNDDWLIQVVTGVPSPAPSAPATPLNSIRLANVLVLAGATGPLLSSAITDTRTAYQLCSESVPPDADMQDEIDLLNQHPWISRARSTDQIIPDNTPTNIIWADSIGDIADGAAIGYANGIFTPSKPGLYAVSAFIQWASNATGRRELRVTANGVIYGIDTRPGVAAAFMGNHVSATIPINAGETFSFQALQTSGGNLNVTGSVARTIMTAAYVGG